MMGTGRVGVDNDMTIPTLTRLFIMNETGQMYI